MTRKPWLVACIAIFAAAPALAKSTPAKPLNLNLPLQFSRPSASATHGTAKPTPTSKPKPHVANPARTWKPPVPPPYAFMPACNNKAYKKPHMFGSAGIGVFSGSDIEGNYETGTVSVAKALGSCSHPSGGITFSLGFGRETINGPGWPP